MVFEIDEQHAHLRIFEGVAHGEIHAVAVVVREGQGLRIEHAHEAGIAALVGAVGAAVGVGGGEEEHVHAFDEGPVVRRDVFVEQALLDAVGEPFGIELALQLAVAFAIELRHGIPP